MIYCTKCGAGLPDEAVFCPTCGAPVVKPEGAQQQTSYQQNSQQAGQQGYGQTYVNYNDPIADANANKVYGILAYLGPLVLVSIFAAPKESRYSKFHANQGLVLLIAEIAVPAVFAILLAILGAIAAATFAWGLVAVIATLGSVIYSLYGIVTLVFAIIGIVNAANNQLKPLPVIGKFTILK
jgi:uncharacterized membrane protein